MSIYLNNGLALFMFSGAGPRGCGSGNLFLGWAGCEDGVGGGGDGVEGSDGMIDEKVFWSGGTDIMFL